MSGSIPLLQSYVAAAVDEGSKPGRSFGAFVLEPSASLHCSVTLASVGGHLESMFDMLASKIGEAQAFADGLVNLDALSMDR